MKKMLLATAKEANRNHRPYVVVKCNKRTMADHHHPHQEDKSQITQNTSSAPIPPPKATPQQSLKELLIVAMKKMEEARRNPKWILDQQQFKRQLEEVERRACSRRPLFEDNSTYTHARFLQIDFASLVD